MSWSAHEYAVPDCDNQFAAWRQLEMSETKCRFNCGTAIHFGKKVVSETSGKLIPLESDGNKHNCPNNPWNQERINENKHGPTREAKIAAIVETIHSILKELEALK